MDSDLSNGFPVSSSDDDPVKESKSTDTAKDDKETPVYEGLCFNCAKRHTCERPRQNGGVWHCEDYC